MKGRSVAKKSPARTRVLQAMRIKSAQMARVRTRNTEPEVVLRLALRRRGWRYVLHPRLPGRPDFVFPAAKLAVFVDGCFWHRCPYHHSEPSTNRQFWQDKLTGNVLRDRRVNRQLRRSGWTVLRIWEHAVFDEQKLQNAIARIESALTGVTARTQK